MGETFQTAPMLAASCPRLGGSEAMTWQRYHFADVADVEPMILGRAVAWERYAWNTDEESFFGTPDMASALRLARDGWQAGADAARKAWAGLEAAMPQARRHATHGYSGTSVNVARMLTGNPRHMRRRTMGDAPVRPILRLIANASAPFNVAAEDMLQHAIAQAAVIDMLEARGYRCEVIYLERATWGQFGVEIAVRAKAADQPRNLALLTFILGHPGMYRRLGFGLVGSRSECQPLSSTLGTPVAVSQTLAQPGTFILPAQQICPEGDSAVKRFRALLRALGEAGCPGIPAEVLEAA